MALSLTISSINCLKYGYKLWKAADDAGLTLLEYFKYLLLLKVWVGCEGRGVRVCSVGGGRDSAL